jgi:cell wall-associated NlpC family hydrolase
MHVSGKEWEAMADNNYQVITPRAALFETAALRASLVTQLQYGERVTLESPVKGFAYTVTAAGDAGWVKTSNVGLVADCATPTHRVRALRTVVRATPDPKAPPLRVLDLNALVAISGSYEAFAYTRDMEHIYADDLVPIDTHGPNLVKTAWMFLNTPYVWGGCTATTGVDCSGLIKAALNARGLRCPHASARIAKEVGTPVPGPDAWDDDKLEAGDLVCWPGHVGIVTPYRKMVHATMDYMKVVEELISDVVDRRGPITAVRRL